MTYLKEDDWMIARVDCEQMAEVGTARGQNQFVRLIRSFRLETSYVNKGRF